MDDQDLAEIAESIFEELPHIRQHAENKIMFIACPPTQLDGYVNRGANLEGRLLFRSLHDNTVPFLIEQVNFALTQPGSCVVVVGERPGVTDKHMLCFHSIVLNRVK